MGVSRPRVFRGFQPQTDVYEPWSDLATPFLNLGELHAGHTDVDDLGEKGCKRAEPEPDEHSVRPSDLSLSCSLSSLPSPVGD